MTIKIVTYNNSNAAQNCCKPNPQAFTGKEQLAEDVGNRVLNVVTGESRALNSISEKYDNFCNGVGQHVCRRIFDNNFIDSIAKKVQGKDNAIKFFLIGGSAITSGMYMQRTLVNKKMDKDRKKTLAVNQFLTFCLSTLGALVLDSHMKKWWNEKKGQFFDLNVPNAEKIRSDLNKINDEIDLKNKKYDDMKAKKEITDEAMKLLKEKHWSLDTFLDKKGREYFAGSKEYEQLMTKMKGFSALRSIIVFALVYRFIVPVAVTKPANILCEKYLEHKNKKEQLNKSV